MCSPPTSSHPVCPTEPFKTKPFSDRLFEEPVHEWLLDQALIIAAGPRQILEHSIREFRTKYANKSEDLYPMLIQADLSHDLWLMQQQPVIMDRYRRFVALKGELEKPSDRNGVCNYSVSDLMIMLTSYLARSRLNGPRRPPLITKIIFASTWSVMHEAETRKGIMPEFEFLSSMLV